MSKQTTGYEKIFIKYLSNKKLFSIYKVFLWFNNKRQNFESRETVILLSPEELFQLIFSFLDEYFAGEFQVNSHSVL